MILPTERFEYLKVNKSSQDENVFIFEQKFENGSFVTKELIPSSDLYTQILTEFNKTRTIFTTTAIIFALILLIFLYAIYRLLYVYRRSLYVPFLVTMFVLDSILIIVVILDNLVFIQFKQMCCIKYMVLNFSYVANLWLMAGMYFQRYISVYHPMLKYHHKGLWRYLSDTKVLIGIALIFGTIHMVNSAPKNCSAPMIVFDETIYSCNNAQNHLKTITDYCRYALCNFASYITPVAIDIVLNISVIFYKPDDKKFSHVTATGTQLEKGQKKKSSSAYKIEPKDQYKAAQKRRHRRIITCVCVVTLQLILYIPILVCAFVLTFMHLNETPYIAAAAFFLQYPYKLIVAHLLCRDYDPKSKKTSKTAEITLISNNDNSKA